MEMWFDERKRVYTREPNHWTEAVQLSSASHAALRRTPAAAVYDLLDAVEDDFFNWLAEQLINPAEEARYVERLPPRVTIGLAGPPAGTLEVLALQLMRQSARWRLDYVWALRDCLADSGVGHDVDPSGSWRRSDPDPAAEAGTCSV